MKKDIPSIKISASLLKCLGLLVDHPFICIETEDGFFDGILPRSTVLNQLNNIVKRFKQTK
jgi:hypothetical protein